ncbi:MAG: metal ABC transporter substrate-binding protein [Clostridiales bacterium]|nr:metal ABC transporter substrate-binding protein [Clostridiales bacterium]MCD7827354.1 metal ABC transporter substrate-binding protein [Clostridiales bacterium]
MKKIPVWLLAVILAAGTLASCASDGAAEGSAADSTEGNSSSQSSLSIVTTIFPIYDWVVNITGSSENVVFLESSGTDLHSFEPTANDILTISEADIFIYIGGESDSWVDNAVNAVSNDGLICLSLMDTATVYEEETVEGMEAEEEEEAGDEDETEYDEHIWLSLKNAEKAVNAITDAVCSADSANEELYRGNADAYIEQLRELDLKYEEMVEASSRDTLLFADRFPFRYLTEDYGLEYYAAFAGCSAESEASFETISFLIEKAKELELEYVLIIDGSDGKIADTVCSESGASVLTVNSCQSVTEDDLNSGITYLSIMEDNLEIFREALN